MPFVKEQKIMINGYFIYFTILKKSPNKYNLSFLIQLKWLKNNSIIPYLYYLKDMNELEQQVRFSQLLADYWMTRGGISALKKQQVKQVELNPFKLYKSVCKRGGAKAVSNSKAWRQVTEEAVSPDLSDEAAIVKKYYMKSIYPYEKKVYFGYEEQGDQPYIISNRMKNKGLDDGQREQKSGAMNMQTKSATYARQNEEFGNLNLLEELQKHFQKEEKEQQLYYLKKNKLDPNITQLKRIQIGLTSMIPTQVVYGLNILLLYSTNSNNNLLFDEFPNIVKSFQVYLSHIYPPRNTIHHEHLKTITLIIRNFCISTSYLQLILKTELFNTLVDIYNKNIDRECSRNIVDIMTGLVKVGWDCRVIVKQIIEGIDSEAIEDVQIGVDLIRGLVNEREESLEEVVVQSLDVFAKLFVSSTPEIKETVLQILAYISDLSSNSRTALAKHPYLLQKLIEVLSSGVQQFEKLCELSALTLSNISVSPGSKQYIRHFEKDLVIIACSDQRIGNIAAGILSEMDQP